MQLYKYRYSYLSVGKLEIELSSFQLVGGPGTIYFKVAFPSKERVKLAGNVCKIKLLHDCQEQDSWSWKVL